MTEPLHLVRITICLCVCVGSENAKSLLACETLRLLIRWYFYWRLWKGLDIDWRGLIWFTAYSGCPVKTEGSTVMDIRILVKRDHKGIERRLGWRTKWHEPSQGARLITKRIISDLAMRAERRLENHCFVTPGETFTWVKATASK